MDPRWERVAADTGRMVGTVTIRGNGYYLREWHKGDDGTWTMIDLPLKYKSLKEAHEALLEHVGDSEEDG